MFKYLIPDPHSISVISDWVELYIAYTGENLAKSQLASWVENSSGVEPPEYFIDSVWQELERREYLYGIKHPFQVVNQIVERKITWTEIPGYMACLIFSLEGNPSESAHSGKLFERLSSQAVRNYIQGESNIYGFPGNKHQVRDLARLMNEKYNHEPLVHRKDRGLDIIAWKPFGDNRASQLILPVQCACGHNWKSKLNDLNLNAWTSYIGFACNPIKAFSIPVVIFDDKSLIEHSWDGGIILDRPRIYRNTTGIESIPGDNLAVELATWCNNRLPQMLQ
jgi:hypothetical protein